MPVNEARLKRLITECLEVGFVICNNDMEEFSVSKIFDILDQILPTAHVLNTGYWPFYSSTLGDSLCICDRFGIYCRHVKGKSHWIDRSDVRHGPGNEVFFPKSHGAVFPVDLEIFIKSLPVGCQTGYDINILIKVQYRKTMSDKLEKHNLPTEMPLSSPSVLVDIYREIYTLQIISRFYMTSQLYSPTATIVFHPNPFFHKCYANYFKTLLVERQADPELHEMSSQVYCSAASQMTSTTFKRRYVNLPVAIVKPCITALIVSSFEAAMGKHLPTSSSQFRGLNSLLDPNMRSNYHIPICQPGENLGGSDLRAMANMCRFISVGTKESASTTTSSFDANASDSSDCSITTSFSKVLKSRAKHLYLTPTTINKLTRLCNQNTATNVDNSSVSEMEHTIPSTSGLPYRSVNPSDEQLQALEQNFTGGNLSWLSLNFPPLRNSSNTASTLDENLEVIWEDCTKEERDSDEADD